MTYTLFGNSEKRGICGRYRHLSWHKTKFSLRFAVYLFTNSCYTMAIMEHLKRHLDDLFKIIYDTLESELEEGE